MVTDKCPKGPNRLNPKGLKGLIGLIPLPINN